MLTIHIIYSVRSTHREDSRADTRVQARCCPTLVIRIPVCIILPAVGIAFCMLHRMFCRLCRLRAGSLSLAEVQAKLNRCQAPSRLFFSDRRPASNWITKVIIPQATASSSSSSGSSCSRHHRHNEDSDYVYDCHHDYDDGAHTPLARPQSLPLLRLPPLLLLLLL